MSHSDDFARRATNDAALNRLRKAWKRENLPARPALVAPAGPPPLRARLARIVAMAERTAPEGSDIR